MTEDKSLVYVVDDDPSVRKALDRLLRAAGYETRTFESALDFLDFAHPDAPGCLVLDIEMPRLNGLELQSCLVARGLALPVIFITGHGTVPASVRAFKSGAIDFLEKPFDEKELLAAVSLGIEQSRQQRRERDEKQTLHARLDTLTKREREVFRLVVGGMLNKQVAFDLGTTEKTIKAHRARVMRKMGAQSLADLVRYAEKVGVGSSIG